MYQQQPQIIVTDNFVIEWLRYVPVGQHHQMFSRPYIVSATEEAVGGVIDRLDQSRGGIITPTIIGNSASGILQHSAVGYECGVNNAWVGQRRYVFIMKVRCTDSIGTEITSYIQGFTQYDGISHNGAIDPDLVHTVNSIIETTVLNVPTPVGFYRKEKLHRIYNVMSSNSDTDLYGQRPVDVIDNINMLNMTSMLDNTGGVSGYNMNAFANSFNKRLICGDVGNGIATDYLTKILNAGVLASKSQDITLSSYDMTDTSSTTSILPEPDIADNRFIKYINLLTGNRIISDSFRFSTIGSIDQSLYDRFELLNINKDIIDPLLAMTPEIGDYWSGQDPITLKAHSLIESAVGLALKYGFSKLFFVASNRTNPTGQVDIGITNFNSFINLEEQEFNYLLEIFKSKFLTDVFLPETSGSAIPMHVEMYVDLLQTSKINLQYAHFNANWYTVPSCASSMYSSMTTVNKDAFDATSYNLGQVIQTIVNYNPVSQQYY